MELLSKTYKLRRAIERRFVDETRSMIQVLIGERFQISVPIVTARLKGASAERERPAEGTIRRFRMVRRRVDAEAAGKADAMKRLDSAPRDVESFNKSRPSRGWK